MEKWEWVEMKMLVTSKTKACLNFLNMTLKHAFVLVQNQEQCRGSPETNSREADVHASARVSD